MKHLLLLHGALGAASQFHAFAPSFKPGCIVHTIEFSGHGKTPFTGAFTIPKFAGEVLQHLDDNQLDTADIFGYSMGGYVALFMARHFPARVGRVISLAAKLHWDEAIAAKETAMMNAEKIEAKVPQFAAELQQRHVAMNWKEHMREAAAMTARLGAQNSLQPEDYTHIQNPVLLLLGDRDKMVTLEETVTVFKALPIGQFGIIPNTHHPFEQVNIPMLTGMIKQFLQ